MIGMALDCRLAMQIRKRPRLAAVQRIDLNDSEFCAVSEHPWARIR